MPFPQFPFASMASSLLLLLLPAAALGGLLPPPALSTAPLTVPHRLLHGPGPSTVAPRVLVRDVGGGGCRKRGLTPRPPPHRQPTQASGSLPVIGHMHAETTTILQDSSSWVSTQPPLTSQRRAAPHALHASSLTPPSLAGACVARHESPSPGRVGDQPPRPPALHPRAPSRAHGSLTSLSRSATRSRPTTATRSPFPAAATRAWRRPSPTWWSPGTSCWWA